MLRIASESRCLPVSWEIKRGGAGERLSHHHRRSVGFVQGDMAAHVGVGGSIPSLGRGLMSGCVLRRPAFYLFILHTPHPPTPPSTSTSSSSRLSLDVKACWIFFSLVLAPLYEGCRERCMMGDNKDWNVVKVGSRVLIHWNLFCHNKGIESC